MHNNYIPNTCNCCGNFKILPDGIWCEQCITDNEGWNFDKLQAKQLVDKWSKVLDGPYSIETAIILESKAQPIIDPAYARHLERYSDTYYDGMPKHWRASW